jgi:hypothetical protein
MNSPRSSFTTHGARPLQFLLFLSSALLLALAGAQGVTLAWNASSSPNTVGYRVRYGTMSGRYSQTTDVGNVTSARLPNLYPGATYFFVVVAYGSSAESSPSNEIAFQAPVRSGQSPAKYNDFNGDGNTDLLWTNSSSGAVGMWLLQGGSIQAATQIGLAAQPWRVVATADLDGDGKYDLVWHRPGSGEYAVWYMNGATATQKSSFLSPDSRDYAAVYFGDLGGNGASDVVFWSKTSRSLLICRNGGGLYLIVGFSGTLLPNWNLVGLADLTGAGKSQLIWRNTSTGEVAAWYVSNFRPGRTVILGSAPLSWRLRAAAHLNNSAGDSLIWENTSSGKLGVWAFDRRGNHTDYEIQQADADWRISGPAYFRNNSNAQILWRNSESGQSASWSLSGEAYAPRRVGWAVDGSWQLQSNFGE